MSNSTHRIEVVPVTLAKHPNADALSIVRVHDGYQAIVRTADWQDGNLAAYAPPDSVIPAGLVPGIEGRVKAIRLRGIISEGLLIKAPAGLAVGDDAADALGITHYSPPVRGAAGTPGGPSADAGDPPPGYAAVYDLEAARRYGRCLVDGERVIATEKIHGANARYTFRDGRMFAGSRTEWKRDDPAILWWSALASHPEIRVWCEANPGLVVYGEVYGRVQDLRYGLPNETRLIVFDILRGTEFVDHDEARALAPSLPWVPVIYDGPWCGVDAMTAHAEGPSVMPNAGHVREGCVIRPERERRDDRAGRVVLKLIGRDYLTHRE